MERRRIFYKTEKRIIRRNVPFFFIFREEEEEEKYYINLKISPPENNKNKISSRVPTLDFQTDPDQATDLPKDSWDRMRIVGPP